MPLDITRLYYYIILKTKDKMVEDVQWGFSSARVDVGGRSPVVIYEVRDTIYSEPHLPALWKWLLIQQPKARDYINI